MTYDKYKRFISQNDARDIRVAQFVATQRVMQGKFPGIVFVKEKDHAKRVAQRLSAILQLDVPVVTSDVSDHNRDLLADRMRRKDPRLPVVVATSAWSTGLDIPALSWVMLAGGGKAPINLVQSSGRALRRADGKPSYEIINTLDAGTPYERENADREAALMDAGYTMSDEVLLQRLGKRPQVLAQQPSGQPGTFVVTGNEFYDTVVLRQIFSPDLGRAVFWGILAFFIIAMVCQ